MNSADKPHWDADSSVSSVLRRSPVFRISKSFLSKFITPSRKPIFWHHGFLETSVAPIAARIRKRLAFHRHELPIIATRVEGELQDAVGVIVVDLSVLIGPLNLVVALAPAGSDYELTDALLGVPRATRVLRCEALVVVVMGGEDHVRSCSIKSLPYGLHFGGVAVYPS